MLNHRNYVYIGPPSCENDMLQFGKCIGYGFLTLLAWVGTIWYLSSIGSMSASVLAFYALVVQVFTFKCYYDDHVAFTLGKSKRVPEDLMHLATLLGGGAAGAVAMLILHHKTQNSFFQTDYTYMCMTSLCIIIFIGIFCDPCVLIVCKMVNCAKMLILW